MSSGDTENDQSSLSKKRKVKALPDEVSFLNEDNFWKVVKCRLETNPNETGEVMVAYEVTTTEVTTTSPVSGGSGFQLDTLTLDQLRLLCRNIGVKYTNKCNKFQCRKEIAVLAKHHEKSGSGSPVSSQSCYEKLHPNLIVSTSKALLGLFTQMRGR
jgi:hypothetical protein